MSEKTYSLFWGGPYSQWATSPFIFEDVEFNCTEQMMMLFKAILFEDVNSARSIMASKDPRKQKATGRKVKNFDPETWDAVNYDIVYAANYHKFTQNDEMFDYITDDTHDVIVEASPYDRIWGIGLGELDPRAKDESQWQGENRLGNVLTELREYLRNPEQNFERHQARLKVAEEIFRLKEDIMKWI